MVQPTKGAAPDTPGSARNSQSSAEALHAAFRRAGQMMWKVRGGDRALFGVLHHVGGAGPVRPTVVAEQLMLDISTVGRHIRALESDGLLTRETDPQDGRAWLLALTPAGADVLEKTNAGKIRMLGSATAGWRADEVHTCVAMINRLADDIARVNGAETR